LFALGAWALPKLPRNEAASRFDGKAVLLSTTGIALSALGVIEGQARGWTSSWVLVFFLAGAVALVGFVLAERRQTAPLIDVRLFTRPAFAVANVAAFVVFFAFVGALVYFSAYFQQVQNQSAILTGAELTTIGVCYAIAATVSGRLVARVGERWPLLIGLLVAGGATLALLRLGPGTGIGAILWNFALLGAGVGLVGTPMTTTAMSAVIPTRAGQASAVINAARQIGQVFGVAVLGALVYAGLPSGSGTGKHLAPSQQAAFVTGLHHALVVAGIALLATAALVLLLFTHRHRRGQTTTTEPERPGERPDQASATPRGNTVLSGRVHDAAIPDWGHDTGNSSHHCTSTQRRRRRTA
jgi:DHA2 family methylenomycin A resistance protein-like MFS transporter